ncbi:hypothetical protein PENSUB_333 [Penicillium subrubescens]|uniref:Cyclase n=1 Tax=Penicillium subrubescens TaxID=1316194 RepID=A0A1Q5UNM7_9EURO|nr:hypothetical protein PENSUB_333 [Penicillium subrubescens]
MSFQLPTFDELPPVEGMPQGCAWGIFDKDGRNDIFGTLNLLTPEVVKAATAEVRKGISVSLNWSLESIKNPEFFRKSLSHKVMKLEDGETEWHDRGCIVGRGVLIDYKSYADHKGIQYSPFSSHRITPSDIETVAAYQGTKFQPGDILIIRFGVTEVLGKLNAEEQAAAMSTHHACGLEGTEEMARWIWNNHFAAVASDNVAVEAMPPMLDGKEQPLTQLVLHQWCLSLFGLPLGELWYLKELAEKCRDERKWTFLLTSAPLNVPGAVGSPANALAII